MQSIEPKPNDNEYMGQQSEPIESLLLALQLKFKDVNWDKLMKNP